MQLQRRNGGISLSRRKRRVKGIASIKGGRVRGQVWKIQFSLLEIHSVSNGTVTYISPDDSTKGGNLIIITANDGTVWTYCHLQTKSPLVVKANVIAGSTIIGQVGNTGTSTGAHLHLQCKQNGIAIDPRLKIGSSDC
jgi:murein DD-endopeptidase MepM/ murein hydrolase activator NlpD